MGNLDSVAVCGKVFCTNGDGNFSLGVAFGTGHDEMLSRVSTVLPNGVAAGAFKLVSYDSGFRLI